MYGKKKLKYNNGGLVAQKTFKGIGSLEARAGGTNEYRAGSLSISKRINDTRVTASKRKDSMGNVDTRYSVEKQLPKKQSIGATKSKYNLGLSYNKQTKSGVNLRFEANKDARGMLSGSMSISKPL